MCQRVAEPVETVWRRRGRLLDGHRRSEDPGLGLAFSMEWVTGIEPALSAWESDRLGPLTAPTWAHHIPLVTVVDPVTPGLMARQMARGLIVLAL
jgi:hypothetical protein